MDNVFTLILLTFAISFRVFGANISLHDRIDIELTRSERLVGSFTNVGTTYQDIFTSNGDGNYSIIFPCEEDDGFYSLTIQKSDDDNEVLQLVVQNSKNQTLDSGQTTAEFGIVSLSGECEM